MGRVGARDTLIQAFSILERDELAAFTRMADELRGLDVHCRVDEEEFVIRFGERPVAVDAVAGPVHVRVVAGRESILDLIDGGTNILEAVRARRLRLTAAIGLMARLSRGQRAFAEGAVRARRMRALLDRFRLDAG